MNRVPLVLRKSFSHVITFKFSSRREQKSVYEDYITIPEEEWNSLVDHVFQNRHDFLMISLEDGKMYRNLAEIVRKTDNGSNSSR